MKGCVSERKRLKGCVIVFLDSSPRHDFVGDGEEQDDDGDEVAAAVANHGPPVQNENLEKKIVGTKFKPSNVKDWFKIKSTEKLFE